MNETLLIAIIACLSSTFTIIITMTLKLCYASKCTNMKFCCGCMEIKRDTEHEQSLRNLELGNITKLPNIINTHNEEIKL